MTETVARLRESIAEHRQQGKAFITIGTEVLSEALSETDDRHNGWTNRETWAFMLHVDNDEGFYNDARECVRTAAAGAEWSAEMPDDDAMRLGYVRTVAADALKDWAESLFTRSGYADEYGDAWPDALADAAAEIGSLWRVNWFECIDAMRGDGASAEW